jgi:hypothetical protein
MSFLVLERLNRDAATCHRFYIPVRDSAAPEWVALRLRVLHTHTSTPPGKSGAHMHCLALARFAHTLLPRHRARAFCHTTGFVEQALPLAPDQEGVFLAALRHVAVLQSFTQHRR